MRRAIVIGMRRWKAYNLSPILSEIASEVRFVSSAENAERLAPTPDDALLIWGATPPPGVELLAARSGAKLTHVEDGFIRSVGLGSDMIPPMSLVLDDRGIYFDATRPSRIEAILNDAEFDQKECARASAVRQFIVDNALTKYNLEPRLAPDWNAGGRKVVLVPGQVETDASIALGGSEIRTNLELLRAARELRPDAFIVYKPHPDVMSGNRRGRVALGAAQEIADYVEKATSIVSCIDNCDELMTITSLSGFDALLRNKEVITFGQPFYAGWGLTQDHAKHAPAFDRRNRRLTLDQLIAGTLLRYPIYWNPDEKKINRCETILSNLVIQRDLLERKGKLEGLRSGFYRRQGRKIRTLSRVWLGV